VKLKHFKLDEFACPCCGKNEMSESFLILLDRYRDMCGFPFKITSGYRCEKHNKEVGGKPDSAHTKGLAVDIAVGSGNERFDIVEVGLSLNINRFGIAKNFIHIDVDLSKPQNVIWTY